MNEPKTTKAADPVIPKLSMIEYPFPLRNELTVKVHLPNNLTKTEADRLAVFLQSLVAPVAAVETKP